jgi:hypothetical protein
VEQENKSLDDIAQEICPKVKYGKEKIRRIIKDFLGEEYLIQHAETLKYDVGKAELAKKRKHRAHEKIDAGADSVVESASAAPIATCQTTVQAVNTEHEDEAGQAKKQEQALEVHDKPVSCCQEKSAKAVRKKIALENKDLDTKQDAPVENKFNMLVEAIKKLIIMSSIEYVKKALAIAESDLLIKNEGGNKA